MIDAAAMPSETDPPGFADAPFHCPPDDMELFRAYERLGNVWKVGALYGIPGSTVHHHIKRTGLYRSRPSEFTAAQIERIREYYTITPTLEFNLDQLALELGKSRQNICRKAKRIGLTDASRSPDARGLAGCRKPKWQDKPHPRGMSGKTHGQAVKTAMSLASRRNWATWKTFGTGPMSVENRQAVSKRMRVMQANRPAEKNYTRTKGGHRDDLGGIYFRSSWEANYARYLNLLVKFKVVQTWEFEPETFWFEGVRRGAVSYKPDFKVHYSGDEKPKYIEIKGWEVAKDRTKWRRMKKYHPHIKLVVVGAKEYRALAAKWSSSIPHWEAPMGARVTVRPCA